MYLPTKVTVFAPNNTVFALNIIKLPNTIEFSTVPYNTECASNTNIFAKNTTFPPKIPLYVPNYKYICLRYQCICSTIFRKYQCICLNMTVFIPNKTVFTPQKDIYFFPNNKLFGPKYLCFYPKRQFIFSKYHCIFPICHLIYSKYHFIYNKYHCIFPQIPLSLPRIPL